MVLWILDLELELHSSCAAATAIVKLSPCICDDDKKYIGEVRRIVVASLLSIGNRAIGGSKGRGLGESGGIRWQ